MNDGQSQRRSRSSRLMATALTLIVAGLALLTIAFVGTGVGFLGYNGLYLGLVAFVPIAVGLAMLVISMRRLANPES